MMRAKTRLFLRSGVFAAGLLLVASAAMGQSNPPQVDPTHYWTYHLIDPVIQPTPISVRDQFFRTDLPVVVDSLTRLVNWVHKNNSPVLDTLIHYTWWNIPQKLPAHHLVLVTNQFGSFQVQTNNLEFMLVPAWKNQPQSTLPHANHYLCYRASGFPPPPQSYDLKDEWRTDVQVVHPLQYLCVPCWKTHAGQVFAPIDTVTHLALYPITPQSDVFGPLIFDQFAAGPHLVQQRQPEYLLVPSLKQEIPTDTKRNTWGRLKLLYR
jgi:hypothetical protein